MKKIVFVVFLTIIYFGAAGVIAYLSIRNHQPITPTIFNTNTQQEEPLYQQFFSDRLIFYGNDDVGVPFLLELEFIRQQEDKDSYTHFYTADFLYGNVRDTRDTIFDDANASVVSHKFLRIFENKQFEDLSTRETYKLELQLDNVLFAIAVNNLDGDFLTKNVLEYTKYYSVGDAQISIDEGQIFTDKRVFDVQAVIGKVYSSDYSKYIYFDGYEDLQADARQFILWDENDNFYLVDQTNVFEDNPYYKTHTWILYKDKDIGLMKKSFVAIVEESDAPRSWKITLPDLSGANIDLSLQNTFMKRRDRGFGFGQIIDDESTRTIGGIVHFSNYR